MQPDIMLHLAKETSFIRPRRGHPMLLCAIVVFDVGPLACQSMRWFSPHRKPFECKKQLSFAMGSVFSRVEDCITVVSFASPISNDQYRWLKSMHFVEYGSWGSYLGGFQCRPGLFGTSISSCQTQQWFESCPCWEGRANRQTAIQL